MRCELCGKPSPITYRCPILGLRAVCYSCMKPLADTPMIYGRRPGRGTVTPPWQNGIGKRGG